MDMNLYRAVMAKNGFTQYQLARLLGMADSTLIRKVKQESFTLHEMRKMVELLNIDDPNSFFLLKK